MAYYLYKLFYPCRILKEVATEVLVLSPSLMRVWQNG
jgi:hypothetical protein